MSTQNERRLKTIERMAQKIAKLEKENAALKAQMGEINNSLTTTYVISTTWEVLAVRFSEDTAKKFVENYLGTMLKTQDLFIDRIGEVTCQEHVEDIEWETREDGTLHLLVMDEDDELIPLWIKPFAVELPESSTDS